jgi:DNA-binding XRE family transcriptional regulator
MDSPSLALARRLLANGQAQALRQEAGVSRAAVARDVGVDPSTVGRWENGRRLPRGEVGLRYCAVLAELLQVTSVGTVAR